MSLRLKFIFITVSIILGFGLAMMEISLPMVERVLLRYHEVQGGEVARTIAGQAAAPLLANDHDRLRQLLAAAVEVNEEVLYAYILDGSNRPVAHTFADGFPDHLRDGAAGGGHPAPVPEAGEGRIRDIVVPLLPGRQESLHLGLSGKRPVEMLGQTRHMILLIMLLLAIAGIFLAALLSELISGPLEQLSRAAMEIGRGNFHHRVPEKGRDEIARVAAAFNTMATELEASIHKEYNTRARLEAIVENSAVGITITDRHGNIMQSNPAFCRMLGYSGEELEGKHLSLFTHPDDVGKRSPVYQQLLEGGIDHVHFQKRYRHKNGRTVWGQLTLSLLRSEEGEPDLVIGMIEDISSRKLLEEERQKANKLESVGILAGGIAHDFNNLLTAVIGNIILARHRVQADANTRELLEAAERASLRAKNLTDQLLTFSRGGAPVKKNVELRALIEDTVRFLLSGSQTRAEFHFATALHPVLADAGQISQVVQNIVKNSEQAMPAGGTITIAAENHVVTAAGLLPEGRYVRISITDQGSGIPEENLSRIFDPYFTTKEKGNGLGLAICYSIIRSHDGLITVDSTVGVGTSFTIYLPAAETPPALVAAEKEHDREAAQFSGKILVMDDDRMVREVIGSMLGDLGFTVVLTADGSEAVAAYKKALLDLSPVHLVIVDLTVPGGMGGRQTLEELRKIDPAVRVVLSSGYTDDPQLTNFADHGFAGVIGKPFAINELVPLLKTFFPGR